MRNYKLYVNQAYREADVIAQIGNLVLVEYTMPKGTTGLQIVEDGKDCGKSVGYFNLPKKWLQAIVDAESDWIANPQGTTRVVLSPVEMLKAKIEHTPHLSEWDKMKIAKFANKS